MNEAYILWDFPSLVCLQLYRNDLLAYFSVSYVAEGFVIFYICFGVDCMMQICNRMFF